MKKDSKIYIAGHKGLVGSAITRALQEAGYNNLIFKTKNELNLLNTVAVENFFNQEKPHYVFLAAAKVGGILANSIQPAEYIYENLQIQNNIIHNSYLHGVKKLLFLGSSCIYPKNCPQPMKEEYLLSGKLEETNESYATAKIAGIKMCQSYNKQYSTNFISVMPTNLYGVNDNFDIKTCHVLPALIAKTHEAKEQNKGALEVWGSGNPKREFLFVDDLADASIFLMNNYDSSELINIGVGEDLSIKELAELVCRIVGLEGKLVFDATKPDGTLRKLLDISKLKSLGWSPRTSLEEGLKITYNWYKSSI